MKYNDTHLYDDIINLPHHVSKSHAQMSVHDRAAQFAPFAALTGYGDAVGETARLTSEKVELDESRKTILDGKLQMLYKYIDEHPEITVTYFKPDKRKTGGKYVSVTGSVKKIDNYRHSVIFKNETEILFNDIYEISGWIFERLEKTL